MLCGLPHGLCYRDPFLFAVALRIHFLRFILSQLLSTTGLGQFDGHVLNDGRRYSMIYRLD